MKKSKKAAILAAVFSASLNMNGCTYGPETFYTDDAVTTAPQSSVEVHAQDSTAESGTEAEVSTESNDEPQA